VTFVADEVDEHGREALARMVSAAATELTRRVGGVGTLLLHRRLPCP